MEYEYNDRKNRASRMKRTHNFFSAAHFAMPLPTVNCQLSTVNWTHTFSAKEKDSETGLSYFGSRYYSSDLSIWLSVDPMSDKYPSFSPYTYCANNPIKLVDPNGEEIDGYEGSNGQYKWFDNHSEQSFTENSVIWTKVTENKDDWNEAMTVRDANIEGLVSLGFDKSQVEKDVRLYDGNNFVLPPVPSFKSQHCQCLFPCRLYRGMGTGH